MYPGAEANRNKWAYEDQPDQRTIALLGDIPARWGRMSPLSRLLIVKAGQLMQESGRLERGQRMNDLGLKVGLVGGTKRGSLHTDQSFIGTMVEGPGLASPALFGYTLPNIPLAEAAAVYGLVGPVYAVFASENPLRTAEDEARMLVRMDKGLFLMLACSFDHYDLGGGQEELSVTLTVVESQGGQAP